jgi:hypothetical protein
MGDTISFDTALGTPYTNPINSFLTGYKAAHDIQQQRLLDQTRAAAAADPTDQNAVNALAIYDPVGSQQLLAQQAAQRQIDASICPTAQHCPAQPRTGCAAIWPASRGSRRIVRSGICSAWRSRHSATGRGSAGSGPRATRSPRSTGLSRRVWPRDAVGRCCCGKRADRSSRGMGQID